MTRGLCQFETAYDNQCQIMTSRGDRTAIELFLAGASSLLKNWRLTEMPAPPKVNPLKVPRHSCPGFSTKSSNGLSTPAASRRRIGISAVAVLRRNSSECPQTPALRTCDNPRQT